MSPTIDQMRVPLTFDDVLVVVVTEVEPEVEFFATEVGVTE